MKINAREARAISINIETISPRLAALMPGMLDMKDISPTMITAKI